VGPIIAGMRGRKIEVGRVFPPLPNFMRVTIGKPEHMEAFVSAFRAVMGRPAHY
jgi:histidinol-phosphate aminotransferase